MFEEILGDFLRGKLPEDDFLQWLESGDHDIQALKDAYEAHHLKALRLEFPLLLLNYLRDQTEGILMASQACGQTPLKPHNPSKYEFTSPIKALEKEQRQEKKSKKTRQLFSDSNEPQFNDPKMQKLQERFSNKMETPLKLTKKSERRSLDPSELNKTPVGLTLGDCLIKSSSKQSKKKQKRRSDPIKISDHTIREELAIMTPEKKLQYDKSEIWESITKSMDKTPKAPIPSQNIPDEIEPCLEGVKNSDQLDKLAILYNFCIKRHYVPNVLVEFYAIFQLLTIKESSEREVSDTLLGSVHNCVYFAVRVLQDQLESIQHFDRATLVYLAENPRLEAFNPGLKFSLDAKLSDKKIRHASSNGNQHLLSSSSVRFQSETDNRATFPDAQTFQDFKKQRDLFYEMLRSKDKSRISVLKLLTLQEHPINMQHFARLFHDQLLSMGLDEAISNDNTDDSNLKEDLQFFSELKKKVPASKLSSFEARFIIRSQYGGPNPKPNFSGSQEFFRDFLQHSTFTFITHLKDLFIKSILTLNDTEFNLEEELPRKEISRVLLSLRILAKFLAFIEILPFANCESTLPMSLAKQVLQGKTSEQGCLDLKKILTIAIKKQRLVLTLPWVIEFCSMLDPISSKMKSYIEVFQILISVYRSILVKAKKVDKSQDMDLLSDIDEIITPIKKKIKPSKHRINMTDFNAFFLAVHLGWFFESQCFPRELFIEENQQESLEQPHTSKLVTLDASKSLSLNLFYNCCPYINELKVILCQFHTGFKQQQTTQLATKMKAKEEEEAKAKPINVQAQLEANFFHNQPASLKQTVEIIIERITSNFVRIISMELIPNDSKVVAQELSSSLKMLCTDLDNADVIKEELLSQVLVMADQSHDQIQSKATKVIEDQVEKKVGPALSCLLPDDTKDPVIDFCAKIVEKRARRNARNWIKKNITKDYFHENYRQEFEKLWSDHIKNLSGPGKQSAVIRATSSEAINRKDVMQISQILIRFKTETSQMLAGKSLASTNPEEIHKFLEVVELSFTVAFLEASKEDKPILDGIVKGFENLTFDWSLAMIVFNPSAMTSNVQDKLVSLWGGQLPNQAHPLFSLQQPPTPIATLFSSRNLDLLTKSEQANKTWDKFEAFVGRFLVSGLLFPSGLEYQCLIMLKKEWPEDLLRRLGSCLNGVIESWKKRRQLNQGDSLAFSEEFLDWFAWLFSNMGNDDFDDSLENFPELCI